MSNATGVPSRTLQVENLSIAVHDSQGSGPPIVLVHGNSSSSRIWQRSLQGGFGRTHRLVAIDLPGHGASADAGAADTGSAYSIPGYAGVVRGVAQQLGLGRALFVGWSLGGHAALEASPELPDAAGFMIFGTPPLPYPPAPDFGGAFLKLGLGFEKSWTDAQAREYVADFFAAGEPVPPFVLEDALRTDGNARAQLAASVGTVGYRDEVALARAMTRPLAILHGAREQIVALPYLQALAGSMPMLWRGQVQVVEGAGHALQWERQAEFEGLLAAFAADCRTG